MEEKKDFILKVLSQEEEKFNKTIDQGLGILEDMQKEMEKQQVRRCFPASMHLNYMIPMDSRWI